MALAACLWRATVIMMDGIATVLEPSVELPYIQDVFSIDRRWFVLQTAPQAERKIEERTAHLGNPIYVPIAKTFRAAALGRSSGPIVERSLFPGYAFVNLPAKDPPFAFYLDDEPYGLPACDIAGYVFPASNSLPIGGVAFVSNNGRPEPLQPGVIEDLKAREAAGEFDETGLSEDGRYVIPRWIKRAKTIRIKDGPFVGYCGSICRSVNSKIVSVWVTIMGATRLIDMPIAFIERFG